MIEGAIASVVLLDSTAEDGAGGVPAPACGGLPLGPTGPDQVVLGGTVIEPSTTRRAFGIASPVRAGAPMLVGYAGVTGDLVFAAVSTGPVDGLLLAPLPLAPHVDFGGFALLPIGAVPALAAHVETWIAPPLAPGVAFAHFTAQGCSSTHTANSTCRVRRRS